MLLSLIKKKEESLSNPMSATTLTLLSLAKLLKGDIQISNGFLNCEIRDLGEINNIFCKVQASN